MSFSVRCLPAVLFAVLSSSVLLCAQSTSTKQVDDKNLPVPNLRLGFQRIVSQRFEFVSSMTVSNSSGEFMVDGFIPGKYSLYLLPGQNNEVRAERLNFD